MAGVRQPCRGCGTLIPKGRTRCSRCLREYRREGRARGKTGTRGSSTQWRQQRAKALLRDGRHCVKCGSDDRLEVDHIDNNPRNDSMTNLMTLCYQCHHDKHEGRTSR